MILLHAVFTGNITGGLYAENLWDYSQQNHDAQQMCNPNSED